VVNNSFIVMCYNDMQKIAEVLGKADDEGFYILKKNQLQKKIHEKYFNELNNTYGIGTQVDLAFPMITGVVPENLQERVEESFYRETEINRSGHFACGLIGLPVVTQWAVENQAPNLMYSMLKKRDYPGYLYMIDNGATTTWEQWGGERSYIHNCYNGIGSWFYQAVGGILPNENTPGYKMVKIQPQVPQGVTWAKTYKETPYGKLSVDWKLNGKSMELKLIIPVGVKAEVIFPTGVKQYRINEKEVDLTEKKLSVERLQSGEYKINYTSL